MLKQEKPIKSICSWAIPLLLPSACPIPSVGANYFQRKTMRKKLIMQLEVPVGGTRNGCMMVEHMLINMKKLVMS